MRLRLIRDRFSATTTTGILTVDGKDFGYVCEDRDRGLDQSMRLEAIRAHKVAGQTAIPAGTYEVRTSYSPHFKRDMPGLLDVPGFHGIRVHAGNTAAHTEGCLLPGKTRDETGVQVSGPYAAWLAVAIAAAEARGERVTIAIERDDAAWAAWVAS